MPDRLSRPRMRYPAESVSVCFLVSPSASMATVPQPKRKTCSYIFHREPLTSLIELSSLVTSDRLRGFVDQYGDILTLLKMVVDPVPLQTLLQFYDPELRCFTFQDYQLAPTLEEYSILLGVPIQHQVPFLDVPKEVDFRVIVRALHLSIRDISDSWKTNGDAVGMPLKFLLRVARGEAEKGNWEAFHAQLAVMIYGIVLFPSMPNFVDYAAVCIFIGRNPVPTLLADTYYAIHSRHGKGGALRCCIPLLLRWFMSLLPVSGPFVDAQSTYRWTQRVMSLTSYDIRWQSYRMDVREVIMSCGEFRNVPLVGTKGCINYNPILSLRQLGFVMSRRPLEAEIAESVYFEKKNDPVRLEQIGRAWKSMGVRDGSVLGKKFAIAMPDYTDWVKKRVETLLLPYDRMSPLQVQPPLILAETVPAEQYKQALMENRRLKEKEQDAQMELYQAKAERLNLSHQLRDTQSADVGGVRSKKRSYSEMETLLDAEHRECLRLQRAEAGYLKKIRDLEKQLKAKDIQMKKEVDQRLASETQLGAEAIELRRQLKEKITPLPECSECELLIDQCHYLKTLIPGSRIADQRPHRYSTRLNQRRSMDQVQTELAEMRANMAQFLTMMQGVARGQEELRALVQRQETVIQASNRGSPVAPPGYENVNVVAAPVHGYATGEELGGIRVNGQPLAAEVNVRATRAPGRHPAPLVDRQEDMFTMMSEDDGDVARMEDRDRKVDALAEKIRAMECQNSLGFDVMNMGLVEGLLPEDLGIYR
ncbi:hypothetical protein KIW84_060484 [Lathyrus oleraceus]|uniref:DUF7745 domain-containing protein n=1 Tax=Pisum sativum TaxID=3888 RepID=A0A9D4W2R2_PEA|nr:hypothetical protein KIW84_060484 [Pisum sativum]